jgi:lysophospholipase L1-like esterase
MLKRRPPKQVTVPTQVSDHLKDSFVKTNIKLIGDSITAGQGGTGFSATGEAIGQTIYKANVNTATCWANMLRNLVDGNYNSKEQMIDIRNPQLKWSISAQPVRDVNCLNHWKITIPNTKAGNKGLRWRFYGTSFIVGYVRGVNYGILDVIVDGVKIGELSAYGTFGYSQSTEFTGLTAGYHYVELLETGRKAAASSGYNVVIEYVSFTKSATVRNWGVSGVTTQWAYENRTHIIAEGDDFVFIQLGTNERTFMRTIKAKIYYRELIDRAHAVGAKVIVMSASPAAVANETGTHKMDDIDRMARDIANETGSGFISNYDGFLQYAIEAGVTIDSLLGDGLHPTDAGYKVMYENIARSCGLSILQDGLTY